MEILSMDDAKKLLKKLVVNKNWLYLVSPFSIGDYLLNAGFSLALQERKHKNATVMIVTERMKNLQLEWKNIVKTIYLSDSQMNLLKDFVVRNSYYEDDNFFYGHFRVKNGRFVWNKELGFVDRYRQDIFSFNPPVALQKPVVKVVPEKNIRALEEKYILDKDKTIILIPYATSSKGLDEIFWKELVRQLKEKNYIVYTNVNGISETPVEGSEPITTSFSELHYVADRVKCFVGFRCGLFDFLAMTTQARLLDIIFFPNWHDDLRYCYPESNYKTFYSAEGFFKPIHDYIKSTEFIGDVYIRHSRIDFEDMTYSRGEMLEKILAAIG